MVDVARAALAVASSTAVVAFLGQLLVSRRSGEAAGSTLHLAPHSWRWRRLRASGFAADARLHRLVDAVEADDVAADGHQRDAGVVVHHDELLVKPALSVLDALARGDEEGVLDQRLGELVVLHLVLSQVLVAQRHGDDSNPGFTEES